MGEILERNVEVNLILHKIHNSQSTKRRIGPVGEKEGDYRHEAKKAYVFGLYLSSIFASVAAVEQLFKHIYITSNRKKFMQRLKEVEYKEFRGGNIGGITFKPLIDKCRKIRKLKPYCDDAMKLNNIRNTVSVHSKYISFVEPPSSPEEYNTHLRESLLRLMNLLDAGDKEALEDRVIVRSKHNNNILWVVGKSYMKNNNNSESLQKICSVKEVLGKNGKYDSKVLQYCWYDLRWPICHSLSLKSFRLMETVMSGVYGPWV